VRRHVGGWVAGVVLVSLVPAVCVSEEPTPAAGPTPSAEPTYVGEQSCRVCHVVEAEHWDGTPHAAVFHQNPRNALERRGCEACHGPASGHVADPADRSAIVSFTRGSAYDVDHQNSMCLECHDSKSRLIWRGSVHERRDLGCSDCHNTMAKISPAGLLRTRSASETCFTCHPKQRLEFRKRSHMPLLEGKISCTDCHDPHGSDNAFLLRADSVNQLCYRCHADKRGPFLWEHAPARENCLNCHRPHGSNHAALLVSSMPFLCQECHAQSGLFAHVGGLLTQGNLMRGSSPDERLVNRSCVNCHSQIHGSNHPSGVRLHR